MNGDGVGTGTTVQKMLGMGWGWGTTWCGRGGDMQGQMWTGTDLAGWGGDGDDFHPHAGLYCVVLLVVCQRLVDAITSKFTFCNLKVYA